MAIRSDITRAFDWFRLEAKVLVITVLDTAGDPVNLGASTLEWTVSRQQGAPASQIYLTKGTGGNGITVGGAGNNVVTITINSTDYDDLPAGIHYHELWDVGGNLLLSYGDAHVRNTRGHA